MERVKRLEQMKENRHHVIGPCTPEQKQEVRQYLIEKGEPLEIFGSWDHEGLEIIFFSPSSKRWMTTTDRETTILPADFIQL